MVAESENSKLIVIRLNASHRIGMGHLFRMLVVARRLESMGCVTHFVVRTDRVTEDIIDKHGFAARAFSADMPEEEIIENTLSDNTVPRLWIMDILETEPEWIRLIKDRGIPVVCFDDLGGGSERADVVFNGIAGCWPEHVSRGGHGKVYSGPDYVVLDKLVREYRRERRIPRRSAPWRLGVSMGGSDTHGATVTIAEALADAVTEQWQVCFFLGPHLAHREQLESVLGQVTYSNDIRTTPRELLRELSKMHAIVCNGGMTLFEACAVGLPVLALANEPHEERTIDYFSAREAAIDLGSVHRADVDRLRATLKGVFSNAGHLDRIASHGMALVDGHGTERIMRRILALAGTEGAGET